MLKCLTRTLFSFTLFTSSCSAFDSEKNVGNNFAIVETDVKYVTLNYCTSDSNCDVGILIVPSFLIDYNYDDKWILAKNKRNDSINYYIVDKKFDDHRNDLESNVANLKKRYIEGPLDSIEFRKRLIEKKVGIKLNE